MLRKAIQSNVFQLKYKNTSTRYEIASVCLDYLTQKPHQMKQLWTTSSRENI